MIDLHEYVNLNVIFDPPNSCSDERKKLVFGAWGHVQQCIHPSNANEEKPEHCSIEMRKIRLFFKLMFVALKDGLGFGVNNI